MRSPFVGVALKRRVDVVELQPFQCEEEDVESVVFDLAEGLLTAKTQSRFQRDFTVVPGILGVLKLPRAAVLITVKEAKQVASVHGFPVFEVVATEVHVPSMDLTPEDEEFVQLLRKAVDPAVFGRGLYFSYHTRLTLTTERQTVAAKAEIDAAWELEDRRFFWNRHLMEPLIELKGHGFVLPVVQGFVRQLTELNFSRNGGEEIRGTLTLIARRSVRRLGTRNWRRGADAQGSVANFVETEQLVELVSGKICSFVQLRGSIPVFWTSIPNVSYKAPTRVGKEVDYTNAFESHIEELLHIYKECVSVNLAHATGSEGTLTVAFDSATRRFSRAKAGFRLINFDFHKECGTTRYHRLSVLFDQIKGDLDRFGHFTIEGDRVVAVQEGVVRTNCVDCLDRTNVVQTVFGRYALESFLKSSNLLSPDATLPAAFPGIEGQFKILWADHGDEISLQYSGTGALKSGFTRTGKRSAGGLIDDGVKSMTRYYLNNFEDGRKQDALDLVSGAFVIGRDAVSPYLQRSPDLLIYTVLTLMLYGLMKWLEGLAGIVVGGQVLSCLLRGVVAWLLAAFIGKFVLVKNGPSLICKPKLRPDLPKQW